MKNSSFLGHYENETTKKGLLKLFFTQFKSFFLIAFLDTMTPYKLYYCLLTTSQESLKIKRKKFIN